MLLAKVILTPLACSNHCDYAAFAPIQQTDSHALLLALLLLLLWSYRSWFGWFSLRCVRFGFHSSAQTQYQVQGRLLLNVVILQCTPVLELLASEDETPLVWWNALLILDLCFHGVNGVAGLECNGLTGKCLHEDLHVC